MVRASTVTAAASSTTVRVEVTVHVQEPQDNTAEWDVVTPAIPTLLPAVRDRLSKRLVSRKATVGARARIEAAFEAGVQSSGLDLTEEDLIAPPSPGIQNSTGWAWPRTVLPGLPCATRLC